MKAVLALVLVALLVVCAQSMIALPRGGGFIRPRWNPKQFKPWNLKRKAVAAPVAEDDEESDFWMALAPLAINLIKNKLTKKRDDFDEEADFINLKKVWGVAKNIGKSYLSSKYGINLDEEEEADSEFLSKLKNWWNSKGKDLAIKGLQIYSQIKNGGAQQGDDEEEEADFINWKKIGSIAKDIGKNYLSTKYGINLDEEEEESDFINWKKVWGTAKDIGKSYLSSKYGINLDEEEESDSADAYSQVAAAGIPISSSGRCHNRNVRSCTSLDGVRSNTLNGILTFKRASGCPVTITGGTEVGHAGGAKSHSNGYKLDIALNSCVDSYITRNFANIGRRGDGAQQYRASSGNVYAREGNHWDITFA